LLQIDIFQKRVAALGPNKPQPSNSGESLKNTRQAFLWARKVGKFETIITFALASQEARIKSIIHDHFFEL